MADNADQDRPRDANELVDVNEDRMVDRPDDTDVGPAYRIPDPVAAMARIKRTFESEMSKFIEGAMLASYGETWFSNRVINRSPNNVKAYLERLFRGGKGKRPVDILDIGNYADVVERNLDAFQSTLNSPQDVVRLRQIRDIRIHYVAHPGDPYSATVQRFANLCIAVMRKCELADAAHEIQLILEEASSPPAANIRMMPTRDIAVEEAVRDAAASSDAPLRAAPPASGGVYGDTDDREPGQPNAEMDAPRSRSPEIQFETEGSERESDPVPPLGGSKPDPERPQQRPDESPRLEAAASAEQLGDEQRALADVGEARRIASSTQGGSSDGGGGPGTATLAGAGDEDRSPLVRGGGDQYTSLLRRRPWLLILLFGAIIAAVIVLRENDSSEEATREVPPGPVISGPEPPGVQTPSKPPPESPPVEAPVIDALGCSPERPMVGNKVECTAELGDGELTSWLWSVDGNPTSQSWSRGDPSYGDRPSFETTFSSPGSYELTLTVANDADDVSKSFNIKVLSPRPTIKRLACSPENPAVYEPTVREPIVCSALLGGGAPDSWSWSGGGDPPSGDKAEFTTVFDSPGSREITLTVANGGDPDSKSHELQVLPLPPTIKSEELKCLPETPTAGETVECSVPLSGGDPDSWRWSGGGDPGSQSWNRGDPPYGDQPAFETTFSSPDSYQLTLIVENAGGSNSAVVKVHVQNPRRTTAGGGGGSSAGGMEEVEDGGGTTPGGGGTTAGGGGGSSAGGMEEMEDGGGTTPGGGTTAGGGGGSSAGGMATVDAQ